MPLPAKLAKEKAIINIRNKDDKCFQWAVLSALHYEEVDQKSTNRVGKFMKWENDLNFESIDFPVSFKFIDKFERRNTDLNINIFGYDGVEIDENEEEKLEVYP